MRQETDIEGELDTEVLADDGERLVRVEFAAAVVLQQLLLPVLPAGEGPKVPHRVHLLARVRLVQHEGVVDDVVLFVVGQGDAGGVGLVPLGHRVDHQLRLVGWHSLDDVQDELLALAHGEPLKADVGVRNLVDEVVLEAVDVCAAHGQPHLGRLLLQPVQRGAHPHKGVLVDVAGHHAQEVLLHAHGLLEDNQARLAQLPLDGLFVDHIVLHALRGHRLGHLAALEHALARMLALRLELPPPLVEHQREDEVHRVVHRVILGV
mmetsp:Transcript_13066/g.31664  ORF Transcript_13066/g.31664 Transcript_13066/m.31664 type:complete len:264 (-) Transcript_13066:1964-2755(-)